MPACKTCFRFKAQHPHWKVGEWMVRSVALLDVGPCGMTVFPGLDSQTREAHWHRSHWDLSLQIFTQLRYQLDHIRRDRTVSELA